MPVAPVNLSLGAEFFEKVRFGDSYSVNDGAILLISRELNSEAVCINVGSMQIWPKACKQYIWNFNLF